MPRTNDIQLNVRSAFARARVREIAEATGMSVTEVVEDALRAYAPPTSRVPTGALVRRGPVLVVRAAGASVSLDEANRALEAEREARS